MSKRSHARIGPPKTVNVVVPLEHEGEFALVKDAVTPVRNRAEKRALIKELTRRARSGNAPDRRPVSRVR